jgi:RND superfamily putative drug exporter
VSAVMAPRAGQSISPNGHTAIIQAGAGASANEMVRAADDLKTELQPLQAGGAAGVTW